MELTRYARADYTRATGQAIDRTGETGLICEAYPDPAIRAFGLWPDHARRRQSYKGDAQGLRHSVMRRLVSAAPWLSVTRQDFDACVANDDCLDALICALVARATELGLTEDVPPAHRTEASAEGWIRLPTGDPLPRLLGA